MRVLVDTNVLADVIYGDLVWAGWAGMQLERHLKNLVINPIIYAELCYRATSADETDALVSSFGLIWQEIPRTALFLASQAFRVYRERGGVKTSPLPDFFIGAHAQVAGLPLLTRDASRYKTYFPMVALISP